MAFPRPRAASDSWPEFTEFLGSDIRVVGVSLLGVVEAVGTPCVRTAAAVVPGTGGLISSRRFASVVVVRASGDETGTLEAWIDADLRACSPALHECRLLGRRSTAADLPVVVQSVAAPGDADGQLVALPADLRAGDILAIPCATPVALFDIRGRARAL